MKRLIYFVIVLLLVMIVVPALIATGLYRQAPKPPAPAGGEVINVRVYNVNTHQVMNLDLEEYVAGVVAAEMPANFEIEALKAQAILARTYAVRRMLVFGGKGTELSPGCDISTDSTRDQAWLSYEELRKRWGIFGFYRNWQRIVKAVEDTSGLIILYNGEPIDPVYHSTSGGHTENSEDVWQEKVPYLRGVPSEFESHSPWYHRTYQFTFQELATKLGANSELVTLLEKQREKAFEVVEASPTGRVKRMKIGNQTYDWKSLREKLGLPSTKFNYAIQDGKVTFNTMGYGHGVGLSQYGADGLARQGKNYKDIIQYYYSGVKISRIFKE